MNWANPFALIGLAAVALPILIHMMARARAREVRVPSLRFLDGTRHQPARRTRLQDIPLLLLRAAAIVAAALAVAGPMPRTAPVREADDTIARAVVLDTSASMQRSVIAGPGGQTVLAAASRLADSLAQAATFGIITRTADPSGALAGAAKWALAQPGRAEVVVVSDFQTGALEQSDIEALPANVGASFRRVGARTGAPADAVPIERRSRQGGAEVVARIGFAAGRTNVDYALTPRAARESEVEIVAARADRATVAAARAAAAAVGTDEGPDSLAHPVVIVFAGAESGDSLVAASTALNEPWQSILAARVLRDPLLPPGATVSARAITRAGRNALLFVSAAAPTTEGGVALIAAVARARPAATPVHELEPTSISDSALAAWTREAAAREPGVAESSSGRPPSTRWLWIVALLLLAAEAAMRRSFALTNRAMPGPHVATDDAA